MESDSQNQVHDHELTQPTPTTGSARWAGVVSMAGLMILTLAVALVYALRPQRPADLAYRVVLALDADAYGPNLRLGEGYLERAQKVGLAGADSLAESLTWRAARVFQRAAAGASTPRLRLAANDRAADAYLSLGRGYLERGRGRAFGLGRRPAALMAAEQVAACAAGIAPTRRRSQINAFVEELEAVLERPIAGRCP